MININGKEWDKLRLKDIEKFLLLIDDDETFFVEFKCENIRNEQLAKEICAFSNSYGGYVFLGVDDNKNIVGCTKWNELRINSVIYNCISPVPKFDIKKFKLPNLNKLYVIKIEEGFEPPYVTNTGKIYQRISSSSDPIKDSYTLHNLYYKKEKYINELKNKLYMPPIEGIKPSNLSGYIDFGFGIVTKNKNKIFKAMDNVDYTKIVELLEKNATKYSITKVGFSICISVGICSSSCRNKFSSLQGGINNFMEILSDGSFRCRIIMISESENNIANIAPITYIFSLFKEIYIAVFGEKFIDNFIEAFKYEKLTVLNQFQPKYILDKYNKLNERFDKFYSNHIKKYGSNIIMLDNRIPLTGFYKIDKSLFELYNLKFDSDSLYKELFSTGYFNLGYIDELEKQKREEL